MRYLRLTWSHKDAQYRPIEGFEDVWTAGGVIWSEGLGPNTIEIRGNGREDCLCSLNRRLDELGVIAEGIMI